MTFLNKITSHFYLKQYLSKFFFTKIIANYLNSYSINFLFKKNKLYRKNNNKNVYLFCVPIWGKKYNKLFFDYCLPTLLAPNNIPYINKNYNLKIFLYLERDIEYYQSLYPKISNYFDKFNFVVYKNQDLKKKSFKKDTDINIEALKHHAGISILDEALSIQISPDLVYPENYLKNLCSIAYGKNFCFTHISSRVKAKKFINEINKYKNIKGFIKISSRNLAKLSVLYFINDFKLMNDNLDKNKTHNGISWRKINDNHLAVVPGILGHFAINFKKQDLSLFKNMKTWSEHDRVLPSYFLSQSRFKIIAGTNLAFCAELSYSDNNSRTRSNQKFNDQNNNNSLADFVNKSIITDWDMSK